MPFMALTSNKYNAIGTLLKGKKCDNLTYICIDAPCTNIIKYKIKQLVNVYISPMVYNIEFDNFFFKYNKKKLLYYLRLFKIICVKYHYCYR